MTFIVAEPCIKCKYTDCVDVCPVDCFHEGKNFLVIDPEECIDCGACEPECPTTAIFSEDDLPEKWSEYVELNERLTKDWPVISAKKDALPEAEEFKEVEDKRSMLDEAAGLRCRRHVDKTPARSFAVPEHLNHIRVVGSRGANRAVERELLRLVRRVFKDKDLGRLQRWEGRALVLPFDPAVAYLAANYLRTASRALWDLSRSQARQLEPLFEEICAWAKSQSLVTEDLSFSIAPPKIAKFPASPLQVRGAVKNALVEGAQAAGRRWQLDADLPDVEFCVEEFEDNLYLSIDLFGGSMHRRGYRVDSGPAPLKENLAAQMLILSGWDARKEILFDPMCGAGTIAIEGVLTARGTVLRQNSRWPKFLAQKTLPADLYTRAEPLVFGNDIDGQCIRAAKRNARRAYVRPKDCLFLEGDFEAITPETVASEVEKMDRAMPGDAGLILTNLPYGERLTDEDSAENARALSERFAHYTKKFIGWRVGVLTAESDFPKFIGKEPKMKKPMTNGPLNTWFMLFAAD